MECHGHKQGQTEQALAAEKTGLDFAMAGLVRCVVEFLQPAPAKRENVVRFGILGAVHMAPEALIKPARYHTEVIVQAVAARSKEKALDFARTHGIPQVLGSYQAIIDEPSIDAVYIALPPGLRAEWAQRALARNKHVLLESPAAANALEAELLFRPAPLIQLPDMPPQPVLLETVHFRFHPAWQALLHRIDRSNIDRVHVQAAYCALSIRSLFRDGTRYQYDLGGGSMMDLGAYNMAAMLDIFRAEPQQCVSCHVDRCAEPNSLCDGYAKAVFAFPGGGVGTTESRLQGDAWVQERPSVTVVHKPVDFPLLANEKTSNIPVGFKRMTRITWTLQNYINPGEWNYLRMDQEIILQPLKGTKGDSKEWGWSTGKQITTPENQDCQGGDPSWTSHQYALQEFVDQVKKRKGSGVWVTCRDSLARARMVDMAYTKAGLPLRQPVNLSACPNLDGKIDYMK